MCKEEVETNGINVIWERVLEEGKIDGIEEAGAFKEFISGTSYDVPISREELYKLHRIFDKQDDIDVNILGENIVYTLYRTPMEETITREDLLTTPIDKPTCEFCEKTIYFDYNFKSFELMAINQSCFDCNFWLEVLWRMNNIDLDPDLLDVIIDEGYDVYFAKQPKNTREYKGFLGYSGREFKFEKTNGDIIESNDVWHRGEVPNHLRHLMKPNGRMI